jgi:tetratricopeptide (TPR) repeat protein
VNLACIAAISSGILLDDQGQSLRHKVQSNTMKTEITSLLIWVLSLTSVSGQITMPAAGGNKRASVSEEIGITQVNIDYDRPGVKGREGKIWGSLVHYGFADLHYGTSKAAPWRAGANENTTIEFSTDVTVEGKPLPAGKYGFFVAMGLEKATLVFSKYNTAWGSFYYDPKDDALRVDVPVQKLNESVEWLKYEFGNQTDTSAVVSLQWEKVKIPFAISVDLPKLQIESFRRLFNSGEFYQYWQNMHTAANYCLVNDINLEEGLTWAERSINTFFGEANFPTLSTYSGLLERLNRKHEADSVMQKALPMGKPLELVMYGSNLNKMKKHEKAFEVFQFNYKKNPKDVYACLGMMMGHYFLGDKGNAVKFGEKGKQMTTDTGFKEYFDARITDIKAGKEVFK